MSENTSWKPGDVVRARSGGPPMTVNAVSRDIVGQVQVHAVWFDGEDTLHHGVFSPDALISDPGSALVGVP